MKKTLLPVIAMAMLLSSCSKNEMVDATAATSTPIGFSSYMGTTTKGVATDNTNFNAFKVNAYHTTAEIAAVGAKTQYITAGDVTGTSGTSGAWTSADYFWPTQGKLSFYAYAPATDVVTYKAATETTMPSITYTTLADAASQADVVVAATLNQTYANADAAVAMAFTHALTRVNFSATGTDNAYTYNVTSLKVGKVLSTGTYTFGTTPAWVASVPEMECSYMTTPVDVTATTTSLNDDKAASLMLIPQNASAITVTIAYTVSNGSTEISNNTAVVTTLTDTWGIGQNIRYNIKLTPNGKKITFAPSVTDWNKETKPDVTPAK